MKTRTALFATSALVALLAAAGTAIAHPGMGHGMGPGKGMGMGMGMGAGLHGSSAATRLADAKAALKITADQEPAWNAYAAVVTRHADARTTMRDQMQARHADPKAAAPDHAAMHDTMTQFRQEMQTQRAAALKDLLAVLTPAQKTLAEQTLAGPGGQRGHAMADRMADRMAHTGGHHMGGHGAMGKGMAGH